MKTAAIYLRVSSKSQVTGRDSDGLSIKGQREACIRKTKDLGAELHNEYIDKGESARSAARPALQKMLLDLAEHKIDYVIVHKLDRLARNRGDDVTINLAIREAGGSLVSCSENIDETPSGMLLHGVIAAVSEFYSNNLASEVEKGVLQKLKAGGTPKAAPLGYLNHIERAEDGRDFRTIIVDPERGPHVRWAFETYATGNETLKSLQLKLQERGLRTRPTKKRVAKPVTVSALQHMLRNPYFVGTIRWKGVEYDGVHEHLISQELFDQVQGVLDSNRNGPSNAKSWRHKEPLKDYLRCDRCKHLMGFTRAKSSSNGQHYDYWYCLGRASGKKPDCPQKYIPADKVDAAVEEYYYTLELVPERISELRALLHEGIDLALRAHGDQTRHHQNRLRELERERDKLLHLFYEDAIETDQLKSEQNPDQEGEGRGNPCDQCDIGNTRRDSCQARSSSRRATDMW